MSISRDVTDTEQVALWYMRHYSADYELCDSEQEAARLGVAMMDNGDASVTGVQFPDGRIIARDNWEAYAAAQQWWDDAESRALAEPRPPRPERKIRDPFRGQVLTVDADEPPWLGTQAGV